MIPVPFFSGQSSAARTFSSSSDSSKKYVRGLATPVSRSSSQLFEASAHRPAPKHLFASKMILYGFCSTGGASSVVPNSLGFGRSSLIHTPRCQPNFHVSVSRRLLVGQQLFVLCARLFQRGRRVEPFVVDRQVVGGQLVDLGVDGLGLTAVDHRKQVVGPVLIGPPRAV